MLQPALSALVQLEQAPALFLGAVKQIVAVFLGFKARRAPPFVADCLHEARSCPTHGTAAPPNLQQACSRLRQPPPSHLLASKQAAVGTMCCSQRSAASAEGCRRLLGPAAARPGRPSAARSS